MILFVLLLAVASFLSCSDRGPTKTARHIPGSIIEEKDLVGEWVVAVSSWERVKSTDARSLSYKPILEGQTIQFEYHCRILAPSYCLYFFGAWDVDSSLEFVDSPSLILVGSSRAYQYYLSFDGPNKMILRRPDKPDQEAVLYRAAPEEDRSGVLFL